MSATGASPDSGPADVYRGFIEAVNRQDLEGAGRFVDAARYRENCVGFTHGFVGWGGEGLGPPGLEGPSRSQGGAGPGPRRRRRRPGSRHGPRHGDRAAIWGTRHQALVRGQFLRLRPGRRRADHRAGPAGRHAQPDAPALRQGIGPDRARRHVLAALTPRPLPLCACRRHRRAEASINRCGRISRRLPEGAGAALDEFAEPPPRRPGWNSAAIWASTCMTRHGTGPAARGQRGLDDLQRPTPAPGHGPPVWMKRLSR